jgi:AraC-like DNA-binding protein
MLERDALIRLCRARDRLRGDLEDPLTVDGIAAEAGMSTSHFIRRFAAVFGETPHQVRIRARLDRAKELLAAGERSVTDVCMEVGFSSLGSFSDSFARRVGVAPSVYGGGNRSVVTDSGATIPAVPGCFGLMCGVDGSAIFEKQSLPTEAD